MSHPSNVGTPSWRAPCRLEMSRTCGCCELRGCWAETSWSLRASLPRLLSVPSRIRRSKLSSKIPKVNGPNPGGNVNTGWGAALWLKHSTAWVQVKLSFFSQTLKISKVTLTSLATGVCALVDSPLLSVLREHKWKLETNVKINLIGHRLNFLLPVFLRQLLNEAGFTSWTCVFLRWQY